MKLERALALRICIALYCIAWCFFGLASPSASLPVCLLFASFAYQWMGNFIWLRP